ncbi:MAG: AsmA family protein [Mariprofundaceae bacterium]|nr:AsmA family protein [Mariprofundaceae bacterium]
MKKIVRYIGITVALLLLIVIATPFLIPADQIRQVVEEEATKAAGMPVKIESLSVSIIPTPSLSIEHLTVEDVKGGTPKLSVGSGSLAVAFGPLFDGRAEVSGITFKAIVLRVSEQAKGKNVHVVHIDKVTGAINLSENRLTMPNWRANLYKGVMVLNAELAPLEGKKRTLTAEIKASDIQMLPLMKDAAGQDKVSGAFDSTLKISASGIDEKAMQHSLKVDGPVKLSKGQFEGIGLSGVAAALVHGNVTGAGSAILFDVFKTQLKVRGQDIYLNDIALNASALNADGHVEIKGNGKLDGQINTSGMKGLSGAKLMVGGTTDSPRIYPAPSSLIGGTIGATLGGPTGAAVGSKIGGAAGDAVEGIGSGIKSLFGK